MAATEALKKLVAQLPDPDGRGMLTENIDKEKIEKTIAEIHKGGRANVLGLIDLLGPPGSEENAKPHYALHCLANHTLVIKDESSRKQLCEVLAMELSSDRPGHIKAFLCQELGWAGRAESVAGLGKLLLDQELSGPASMALVAIGKGAAVQFRSAWPKSKGRARLHIIDGLAAVAEAASVSIFQKALSDEDAEIRIAAGAGLSKSGDQAAAAPLLKAFQSAQDWESFQAAKNCLVLSERLASSGKKREAKSLYEQLSKAATADSSAHIRHAVKLGLAKIAS